MTRRLLPLLALLFVTPRPVTAQEDLRHAAVFEEHIDGEVQGSSAAEDAFIEAMLAQGAVFVDEEQSRKIRSVTDAGALISGDIAPVVMSLDTDLLIVGVCQAELIAKEVMGRPLVRYSADLRVRVISVDSGEVIAAFSLEGEGMKFSAPQAARAAARDAGGKIATKVAAAVKQRQGAPTRMEVLVEGTRNVMETDRVRAALADLDGVTSVRVLTSGRPLSKLSVRATASPRELAMALQATSGVEVFGYSASMIKAEFSAAGAMDLALLTAPFESRDTGRKDRWMADALPRILETELANCPFLVTPGPQAKVARDRSLTLSGSFSRDGDRIRIDARLSAASTGRVAVSAQEICDGDQVSACGLRLAEKLRAPLLKKLREDHKLFKVPLGDPSALAASAAARKPLRVDGIELDDLFPARAESYTKRAFGEISVTNSGDQPLDELVITAALTGGLAGAQDLPQGHLAPGAGAKVPLKLVLDRDALAGLDESRTLVLELRLSYVLDGLRVEQRVTHPVLVHGRNSLRWSEAQAAAAFVTPAAPGVTALVARAMPAEGAAATDPLQIPALLHQALSAAGVRYLADAASTRGAGLDTVRFPDETLAGGVGDCDDLSVLYASLLEAAGRPAALLLVPGHVLVAFDTGIPAQAAQAITLDPARVLSHRGTVWIPVETTKTGANFQEAWDLGAVAAREAGDKLDWVRIRKAWRRYPPTDLSQLRPAPGALPPTSGVGTILAALEARRLNELTEALNRLDLALQAAPADPDLWRRRGVLLAREGRLDEARTAVSKAGDSADALANRANLDALSGDSQAALTGYRKALEEAPKSIPIRLNLGVLLYVSGDKKAAMKLFMTCLTDGAEEAVGLLGRKGCGLGGAGGRGAAAGAAADRGLAELVQEAFQHAGVAPPPELEEDAAAKAKDAGAGTTPLEQILYWL